MDLENNVIINLFSIIILFIIYLHCLKNDNKGILHNRVYLMMVKTTMVLLIFDIFSRFDGQENIMYPILNHMGNFLVFGLSLVLPSLWVLYVYSQIFIQERRVRKFYLPLFIINGINLLIALLSEFFGFYYYIDEYNLYHRGPWFFIPVLMTFILLGSTFVFLILNSKIIDKNYYRSLLFFAVPPLASIILQVMFYGVSLMLNCIVVSLLIVFLNIQNRSLLTDFLTGINNRKSLEGYLQTKINSITRDKTFSAIIIDLDGFKKINDTFGHNEGDSALQISAKLLNSCLRSNDFIARFGGDEFFIVLDTSNRKDLEDIISRINKRVEKYNNSGEKEYKISFSMGYEIYDYRSKMGVKEFQKHIDLLMYENKHKLKMEKYLRLS